MKKTAGGPGKSFRDGISLVNLFRQFPDNESAERWLEYVRWGEEGPVCVRCDCQKRMRLVKSRKPMKWACGACRRAFSVRCGTVLAHSKIPLQNWVIAIYLQPTSLRGVSSMKLHRDLGITQKSAWFLAHRLREAMLQESGLFADPVEVDETSLGGLEKNKHVSKKLNAGRGPVRKTAVVGARVRATGKVNAKVVGNTSASTLQCFAHANAESGAKAYTDDTKAYMGLPNH